MTALLMAIGGAAPRSTIPNLAELLSLLLNKLPECRPWMQDILFSVEPISHPLISVMLIGWVVGTVQSSSVDTNGEAEVCQNGHVVCYFPFP